MRRKFPVRGVVLFCLVAFGISGFLVPLPSRVSAISPMWQKFTYRGPVSSRPYFVYTPVNYQLGTAVPLIVMLHGCTQTAVDFANSTRMNQLADQYKFIVVYPQQTSVYSQNLCWNWFKSSNQSRDQGEPAVFAGIVQAVEQKTSQWTIDTSRVYVAGFSAGAAMAVILGATYPDLFAAIGVHSGVEYQAATSSINSLKVMSQGGPDPQQQGQAAFDAMGTATRVIPTIVFQGTIDSIVNPINGNQVVQQWMQTDYLASSDTYTADFGNPSSSGSGQIPGGYSYTVSRWNDGQGDEVQEYWRVEGLGHAWSGGSPGSSYTDPSGPDASLAMFQFFMGHPMSIHMARKFISRWYLRTLGDRLLDILTRLS
jgi:poly(hydroxyalkanoate) depolymerase family esterase